MISSVIYANGLESRWIQSHPTILYDNQLVDTLLGRFDSYMRNKCRKKPARKKPLATVFTKQPLSQGGMAELDPPLKLLNGADILTYIKNIDTSDDTSEAAKQHLNRTGRLKPLWKTEAAFTPFPETLAKTCCGLSKTILNPFWTLSRAGVSPLSMLKRSVSSAAVSKPMQHVLISRPYTSAKFSRIFRQNTACPIFSSC